MRTWAWSAAAAGLAGLAAACALPWFLLHGGAAAAVAAAVAAVAAAILVGVREPRVLWLALIAMVPFTATVAFTPGSTFSLPLEPAMAVFALVALCRLRHGGRRCSIRWGHPLTAAVVAHLVWLAVASAVSLEPTVSGKYLLARLAYVAVFLAAGLAVLAAPTTVGGRHWWNQAVVAAGAVPLALVAAWVLARHAGHGFSRAASYTMAQPFFANHLEYAMAAVVWLLLAAAATVTTRSRAARLLGGAVVVVLVAAVATAAARSAWLALAAGVVTALMIAARPRPLCFVAVILSCGALVGWVGWSLEQLVQRQRLSQQPVSNRLVAELVELDLVSGESSRERANRWRAALAMVRHRPLVGVGPGAYERHYGWYQDPSWLTPVSTYQGDRGDAHSELATTLAEQGVVGLAAGLAVLIAALATGARVVRHAVDAATFWMGVGWTSALVALTAGNAFNSFLELDKLAPVTWLALAALVAADQPAPASTDPISAPPRA